MSNQLRHYGVMGMKWGRRKKRVAVDNGRPNNINRPPQQSAPKKPRRMSKKELQARVNRLRLEQELARLLSVRGKVNTRLNTHSDAYKAIRDFKAIKRKYNGTEYTFDLPDEIKNLEGIYKQGGSINKNKINKFLNYAKG